jgi:hypothetical protein
VGDKIGHLVQVNRREIHTVFNVGIEESWSSMEATISGVIIAGVAGRRPLPSLQAKLGDAEVEELWSSCCSSVSCASSSLRPCFHKFLSFNIITLSHQSTESRLPLTAELHNIQSKKLKNHHKS